jgi:uncharacterized protein (DUF1499 family)
MTTRKILLLMLTAALLAGTAFLAVWPRLGPADLGDVDFATLQRRNTPNDALACLPEHCVASADVAAPIIQRPLGEVFLVVRDAVMREPGLEQVGADAAEGTLRFVQRSRIMGFPDTINVKVVPTADGAASAVLIYSRSKLGRGDMGVNLARIQRWIGLIEAAAQK